MQEIFNELFNNDIEFKNQVLDGYEIMPYIIMKTKYHYLEMNELNELEKIATETYNKYWE